MSGSNRDVQPKDEHPMHEIWYDINLQARFYAEILVYEECMGFPDKWDKAMREYKAMRAYVASLQDEPLPYCRYLEYRSSVIPMPRVDRRLIGEDQR